MVLLPPLLKPLLLLLLLLLLPLPLLLLLLLAMPAPPNAGALAQPAGALEYASSRVSAAMDAAARGATETSSALLIRRSVTRGAIELASTGPLWCFTRTM